MDFVYSNLNYRMCDVRAFCWECFCVIIWRGWELMLIYVCSVSELWHTKPNQTCSPIILKKMCLPQFYVSVVLYSFWYRNIKPPKDRTVARVARVEGMGGGEGWGVRRSTLVKMHPHPPFFLLSKQRDLFFKPSFDDGQNFFMLRAKRGNTPRVRLRQEEL